MLLLPRTSRQEDGIVTVDNKMTPFDDTEIDSCPSPANSYCSVFSIASIEAALTQTSTPKNIDVMETTDGKPQLTVSESIQTETIPTATNVRDSTPELDVSEEMWNAAISDPESFLATLPALNTQVAPEMIKLATGTGGTVYKSSIRGSSGSTTCAVKVFPAENPVFDAVNEYILLQRLNNSGRTVKALALLKTEEMSEQPQLALVMAYCPNNDLLSLVTGLRYRNIKPPAWLLPALLETLVRAVESCHNHGVVHRDIKPENVLIDATGKLLLGDFGYAVDISESAMTTKSQYPWEDNSFCTRGTGSFRSPEVVAGRVLNGDSALLKSADIWALAMLWYQIRFLSRPWTAAVITDKDYKRYVDKYQSNKGKSKWAQVRSFKSLNDFREDEGAVLLDMANPDWKCRPAASVVARSQWAFDIRARHTQEQINSEVLRLLKMVGGSVKEST